MNSTVPGIDGVCYDALILVTPERGSACGKMADGLYVRAWTFATGDAAARDQIRRAAREEFDAALVEFDEFDVGDPRDVLLPGGRDGQEDVDRLVADARAMTDEDARRTFAGGRVMFGTAFIWKRRWWEFWKWFGRSRSGS